VTTVEVIQDLARAAVALHPVRLQILELLANPASPSTLSKTLGIPRQHLNYHVRELEAAGLVEMVEEKKRGSVTERLYQATARSYVVGPKALGGLAADPSVVADRFSVDYLVALGSRLVADACEMSAGPALALETTVCFASDADRGAFARELTAAISRLVNTYHREDGDAVRLVVAAHAVIG